MFLVFAERAPPLFRCFFLTSSTIMNCARKLRVAMNVMLHGAPSLMLRLATIQFPSPFFINFFAFLYNCSWFRFAPWPLVARDMKKGAINSRLARVNPRLSSPKSIGTTVAVPLPNSPNLLCCCFRSPSSKTYVQFLRFELAVPSNSIDPRRVPGSLLRRSWESR